ncbi:AAA family ATPase [Planctomicrobium sp. SH664]|uniref:AAA family ATPase n=1 Tax=Planctomicrobium sp. SH664 TaxID=3448125 RepID=UPI003F5BD321
MPVTGPRIVVVGTSGSGKSTFSRRLSEQTGIPHLELDRFHWGPNWTERPDFVERVTQAIGQEQWIVDGNYRAVREVVWQRATALVWLNYSFPLVFWRALRRTVHRVITGKPIAGENRETWRNAFLSRYGIPFWVVRTHAPQRREYRHIFEQRRYPHLQMHELRRPREAERFLAEFAPRSGC